MKKQQFAITLTPSGYGHYKVTVHDYRGKDRTFTTDNMPALDDYRSEEGERDGRELRQKRGYEAIMRELRRVLRG